MKQMEQTQENCKAGGKTKRLANFELLRCIAMMMVVVLHFLGKSGILAPLSQTSLAGYEYLAWGVESLCIVAVNVYMLISGYFLTEAIFLSKGTAAVAPGMVLQCGNRCGDIPLRLPAGRGL